MNTAHPIFGQAGFRRRASGGVLGPSRRVSRRDERCLSLHRSELDRCQAEGLAVDVGGWHWLIRHEQPVGEL
jgi:hypothetical protein